MNDKTLALVQTYIGQITEGLKQTGTLAWHTYLQVIQASALVVLLQSFAFVIIATIIIFVFQHFKIKAMQKGSTYDNDGMMVFFGTSQFILCAGIIVVSTFGIFNMWTWIAIFNPQVYAANEIISRILYPHS